MNKQQEPDHNELAVWLNNVNTKIEPYSKLIAVVVGAVLLGAIGWGFYRSNLSGQRSDATLQLLMDTPDIGKNYPDTPAAAWSTLYQGNKDLEEGIQALYADRSDAETMLGQAKDLFNDALSQSEDKLLNSRAYLGIALASESLGDLDGAVDAYKKCMDMNESTEMVRKAESRIDELSRPETQEFVAWFAKQDFAPADPSLPPSLPGGTTLPDLPDLKLPTLGTDGDNGDDEMELEDTGLELPADGDAKAADGAEKTTDTVDAKENVVDAVKEATDAVAESAETATDTAEKQE